MVTKVVRIGRNYALLRNERGFTEAARQGLNDRISEGKTGDRELPRAT